MLREMSAKRRKKVLTAVDAVTAGDPGAPISYSVEEQGYECGSITYLPSAKIESTLRLGPPTDWHTFQHQQGAAFASNDLVQVAIQGESTRTVTLTGIHFDVERATRHDGALFSASCGGGINARGLVVDVEGNHPRLCPQARNSKEASSPGECPAHQPRRSPFPGPFH